MICNQFYILSIRILKEANLTWLGEDWLRRRSMAKNQLFNFSESEIQTSKFPLPSQFTSLSLYSLTRNWAESVCYYLISFNCYTNWNQMSKASTRILVGLLKLHHDRTLKPSSSFRNSLIRTYHSSPPPPPSNGFLFRAPISNNATFRRFLSSPSGLGFAKLGGNSSDYRLGLGHRFFSFKPSGFGKAANGNIAKKVLFDKPASAIASTFSRYREAIGLQIEAFCKRNYIFFLGVGGILVCALLWRLMFGIANTFIGLSEGMAKYGFLALSSSIVAFAVSFALWFVYWLFSHLWDWPSHKCLVVEGCALDA